MMYEYEMKQEADKNLLNKIVSALTRGRGIESNTSKKKSNIKFCVEETLAPADVKVTVKEIGKLSFPLSRECVQKLINISTTAKFGMGEKTVLDQNVRHTQVIDSKSLNVTINQKSLLRIIGKMQKALSLPASSTLTPHLHNMLIYGPGQFFDKHRDSEKLQNMVATLVIVLPSPHVGGDLIIEHGKKKHVFSTESVDEQNARCICFYSDCLHKVDKVKSGFRVALTFNVVLETSEYVDTPCTNEELKSAVLNYFNTATVKSKSKKIVFFLNHKYSKQSLGWNLLKGEDCQYAANFRSVAQELDLDVHLVLANIHQCWSSESEYKAKPDWLVDTDSTLDNWIDVNNVKLPYGLYITSRNEICFTLETHYKNFEPTEEDFSGPTGNEGSTVDYWYMRAAIVLWQKTDLVMIKFELNYDEAMTELRTLISVPGNETKVMEILDKAAKLLYKNHTLTNNFETFVNIALYIKQKKRAQAVLSPFHLNILIAENVQKLAQLQHLYGIGWLIEFLEALRKKDYNSSITSEAINSFVREFINSGGDRSVMEFLLNAEVISFIEKCANLNSSFYFRNAERLEKARELFKACTAIGNAALQEKLAQHLTSQPKLFPNKELVKLYRQLQKTLTHESSGNLELLRVRLEDAVKQELSQIRHVDDWSISAVPSCSCEHCNVLINFLRSRTDVRKLWPANGNIRKHIISILKRSKAPVDVTEDRGKKPFSIVLVKSATLHTEAAEKCAELKKILHTLEPKTAPKKGRPLTKDGTKRQKL